MSNNYSTIGDDSRRPRDPSFGERLRAARTRQGLSQRAIGAKVGVTSAAISTFEKGRIPSDPRVLFALARELSVPLGRLLGEKESKGRGGEGGKPRSRPGAGESALPDMLADCRAILSYGNRDLISAARSSLRLFARSARYRRRS